MGKKEGGRNEASLLAGIDKANALIAQLSERDGIDTTLYGLMVRRHGEKSMAMHRGAHPSEDVPTAAQGSRDVRLPKAEVGLSLSGALKTDFSRQIEDRHRELAYLHRWWKALQGRRPGAADFRWDPVMLEMLRHHRIDLDALVAHGPGEFVDVAASRDYPGVTHVLPNEREGDVAYLGCVDGDVVRALRIRYAKGIAYSWNRGQPDHVELLIKDRRFPETVLSGLRDAPFMAVVDHPSLAPVAITGYAQIASTISFKSATRLVRL